MDGYIIINGRMVFVGDDIHVGTETMEVLNIKGNTLILDGGVSITKQEVEATQ